MAAANAFAIILLWAAGSNLNVTLRCHKGYLFAGVDADASTGGGALGALGPAGTITVLVTGVVGAGNKPAFVPVIKLLVGCATFSKNVAFRLTIILQVDKL